MFEPVGWFIEIIFVNPVTGAAEFFAFFIPYSPWMAWLLDKLGWI